MAAEKMGITKDGDIKEYIGTAAEKADIDTSDLGPGSTYWAWDTKIGYVFDGTDWRAI